MKKIMSLVLVFIMCLGAVNALGAEVKEEGEFYYEAGYSTAHITGLVKGDDRYSFVGDETGGKRVFNESTLIVPAYLNGGLKVTLKEEAFKGKNGFKKIVFEEGIQYIPNSLCREMPNLEEVVLPKSVISIGDSAFCDCVKLKKINLENVRMIGTDAFKNTPVKIIEEEKKEIDYYLSDGKATIRGYNGESTVVNIPEIIDGYEVTSIGHGVFSDRDDITKVIIPSTVTSIGKAFSKCTALEEIVIPDSVSRLSEGTFVECRKLKKVVLGKGIQEVEAEAFLDCAIETLVVENAGMNFQHGGKKTFFSKGVEKWYYVFPSFNRTYIGEIIAPKGSTAEDYAKEKDIKFVSPEGKITVKVNDKVVKCKIEPFIENDVLMVPLREVFEAIGASVSWDEETKTAIGVKEGNIVFKEIKVKIPIGESAVYRNGNKFEVDGPARIVNDSTFISSQAVVHGFAAVVRWEEEERILEIFSYEPGVNHELLRTWYEYDDEGRLLMRQLSNGQWEWYKYDERGNKTQATSESGYVYYTYDENNNLIFQEDSYGFKIEYTYDENGNMIKDHHFHEFYRTDFTNEYTYNEKGQKISTKYDDGSVRTYKYDKKGNLIEEKSSSGSWEKHTYDKNGNLVYSVTDYGAWKKYEYDNEGKRVYYENSVYDTNTTYEYDEKGNKIRETYQDGDYQLFKYNEKGLKIYSEYYSPKKD